MARMNGSATHPHFVYLAFDAEGDVLYIGCTGNLEQRQAGHRSQSRWYREATYFRLVGPFVGTNARRRALVAEGRLIAEHRPKHNADRAESARAGADRRRRTHQYWHDNGILHNARGCGLCRRAARDELPEAVGQ